jgi:D-3-phosphoglycerate dehydrogenase
MSDVPIVVPFPSHELMPRYGSAALEKLARLRQVVTNQHPRHLTSDELYVLAPRAAVVVDGRTALDAAYPDRNRELLAYARAGVEILGVDIPAATATGVIVFNTPGLYSGPIVERVVATMVTISRGLIRIHNEFQAGTMPDRPWRFHPAGQPLGMIGLGEVGRHLARVATCLGMIVLAAYPYVTDPPECVELIPMDNFLRRARFISVLANPTTETRGLIGRREIGLIRRDAYLLNTAPSTRRRCRPGRCARGRLHRRRGDRRVRERAGLLATPVRSAPNVMLAPHVATHTTAVMERLALASVEAVERLLRGEPPATVANRDVLSHPRLRLRRPPG